MKGPATKYKPEYADKLKAHLKQWSFTSFGGVVRVSHNTLYDWLKVHRDFREAYESHKNKNAARCSA